MQEETEEILVLLLSVMTISAFTAHHILFSTVQATIQVAISQLMKMEQ